MASSVIDRLPSSNFSFMNAAYCLVSILSRVTMRVLEKNGRFASAKIWELLNLLKFIDGDNHPLFLGIDEFQQLPETVGSVI